MSKCEACPILVVCISNGNSKMGKIPSVSLPPVITCRKDSPCAKSCYARRFVARHKQSMEAYNKNLEILQTDPTEYWRQVNEAVHLNRFFRFHVSGDIVDSAYFEQMVQTAVNNPHCELLAFTKKYEIVNEYVGSHIIHIAGAKTPIPSPIPENLHIVFSGWRGLEMNNPYNFPEAHVRYRDGYCEAREDAVECYGNCTDCSIAGCGCWKLKNGEQVVFNQH